MAERRHMQSVRWHGSHVLAGSVGSLITMVAAILFGASSADSRIAAAPLETTQLNIVDERGRTVLSLLADARDGRLSAGRIEFVGSDNKPSMQIGTRRRDHQPYILMYNDAGQRSVYIEQAPSGMGNIGVFDREGDAIVQISGTKSGDGIVQVNNGLAVPRAKMVGSNRPASSTTVYYKRFLTWNDDVSEWRSQ